MCIGVYIVVLNMIKLSVHLKVSNMCQLENLEVYLEILEDNRAYHQA